MISQMLFVKADMRYLVRRLDALEGDLGKGVMEHLALDGRNLELESTGLAAAIRASERASSPCGACKRKWSRESS